MIRAHRIGWFVALGLAAGVWLGDPAEARACTTRRFCALWRTNATDGGSGNMLTASEFPARGVRVTILRPYPEPALDAYLSEEAVVGMNAGCVEYDSQFPAGHKVVVHAEAVLDATDDSGIHLRAFASEPDRDAGREAIWIVHVPPYVDGMYAEAELFDDDGDDLDDNDVFHGSLATIMGLGTAVLHRLHGLSGSTLTGVHRLDIFIDSEGENAGAAPDHIRIGSADALDKKFLLAHEIGHWIQFQITGGMTWAFDYDYGPLPVFFPLDPWPGANGEPWNDACRFTVVTPPDGLMATQTNPNRHGIRSAEYSSGSMPEGFGHFVAAVAFNEPEAGFSGTFKYYKDVDEVKLPDYEDFEDPAHPGEVSLAGGALGSTIGGRSRWTQLECSEDHPDFPRNDWDWPIDATPAGQEVSTEIDWLRLFWQLEHGPYAGAGDPPSFWEVVHLVTFTQMNYPWTTTLVWPRMDAAIDDDASGFSDDHVAWFRELSADAAGGNGVFHGP